MDYLLLQFFKALSNESRLAIVGLLARHPASVGELATVLELREPTVSHHLAVLKKLGLVDVRAQGTTRRYELVRAELETLSKRILAPGTIESLTEDLELEDWERKVLDTFLDGTTLKRIPAKRKKRDVVLRWLVERFEPDRDYSEREVNALIGVHHADFATLRRELVMARLMAREAGIYRRT